MPTRIYQVLGCFFFGEFKPAYPLSRCIVKYDSSTRRRLSPSPASAVVIQTSAKTLMMNRLRRLQQNAIQLIGKPQAVEELRRRRQQRRGSLIRPFRRQLLN